MKKVLAKSDLFFRISFLLILILGLVFLTSASSVVGYDKFQDNYFFIKRQLFYGILPGFLGLLFFSKFDYKRLKDLSFLFFVGSIVLLILVFIPGIGSALNTGNRSWIVTPFFSFQPAEFAKFAVVIYLAAFLSKVGKEIENFKEGFVPILMVAGVPIVLIMLQPDIGTLAILVFIVFGLLFIARARYAHLGGLGLLAILGFVILILIAPYRLARFTTFLHPEMDTQGSGYHINQSFIAIGSGGLIGEGLGESRQKYQYLPEVHADSIFAVMAEELGFVLTVAFLVLFLVFIHRGLMIAGRAPDEFGKLLSAGILIWIVSQAFLNIAAMVGLMPLTGVPLPFVSHGGTALAILMCAIGVILNISKYSNVED